MDHLTPYLLVRDRDGAVLAELDSAESALRMLDLLGDGDIPLRDLSLVRCTDSPGELVDSTSVMRIRPAGFGSARRP